MDKKGDRIFLYGINNLDVFYLSGRLSNNGIYMYIDMDSTHINDEELEASKRREFAAHPPALMIVNSSSNFHKNTTRSAEDFFMALIRDRYNLRKSIGGADFYFLKDR